ncbi:MAG: MiaB/RimO family radical SAM methylthiotransferase [Spirochaetes bacterium]|nr:MiaB/RimO family radical SAM methylthiotransferase [Spirochaetota bacterium]
MNSKNKIFLISLGCPKNEIISEKIAYIATKNNFDLTENIYEANFILINSCGFIEDALKESINETLKIKKFILENNLESKIILTGCATIPFGKDLKESLYEADFILNYDELLNFFNSKNNLLFSPRFDISKNRHYNYLAISEGCSKKCTYCIIPTIKGEFIKYPEEIILEEAKRLKYRNTKELIIVSQDTLSYGKELISLMYKLSNMNFPWIRIMYLNPDSWDDDFLQIYKIENILKYFEIPVQHLSNNILKKMGRKKSYEEIEKIIFSIKERFPEASIRTTIIVGFPGETKNDFEFLLDKIEKFPFDIVGTFIYSDMSNAPSYKFKDKIPLKEKIRRLNILNEKLKDMHSKNTKKYINNAYDMIIDNILNNNNKFIINGRIYSQAPEIDGITILENPKNDILKYRKGNFLKIYINDSILQDLIATEIN